MIPKSIIEWTKKEYRESEWKCKGLNAIIRAMMHDKYRRIPSCTTLKQV